MTDNRPEPKYGQYAPIPPVAPNAPAPYVQAPETPTPRLLTQQRRTWDVVLTTLLLFVGVIDVVTGWRTFAGLADGLTAAYAAQNYPAFTSEALATTMGLALNIARGTVLALTIVVSMLRIRAGRIAVWVPIVGAVVAGILVIIGLIVVIMQDPALAEYVQRTTTP
jgi:uncharacterized membrane protein YphA (DoxX/SURF4 family)